MTKFMEMPTTDPRPAPLREPRKRKRKTVFGEWVITTDEEFYASRGFPTKEAAVAAVPAELDLWPGDTFWVGKTSDPKLLREEEVDPDWAYVVLESYQMVVPASPREAP